MKILIISLPDLLKISPQRPHFLINNIAKNHKITLYCNSTGTNRECDPLAKELLKEVEIKYFSSKNRSQIIQELVLPIELSTINLKEYDLCLSFNSLISMVYLSNQKKNKSLPLILDLCDDLPEIFTASSQMPNILKPFGRPIFKQVLNYIIKKVDGVIYVTDGLAVKYNLPQEKSLLIPNGIDFERFTKLLTNSTNPKEKKSLSIGFVGYLGPWVDFTNLFISLKRLNEMNENGYKLYIAGSGEGASQQKKIAQQLRVEHNVSFLGSINYDSVPDFISKMDVCVIPFDDSLISHNALPIKLFEYFALKKPVIASPLKGIMDAVGDAVMYASTPEDYQRILEMYKSGLYYENAVEKGFFLVQEKYSWKKISVQFEKFMESRVECGQ